MATYLSDHPDIGFSSSKEPHYFNTDQPGFRWAHNLEEYLSFFEHIAGQRHVGESSVQYLYSDDAAANIHEFAPDAKIIIFTREVAAFIRSYHNHLLINLDEDNASIESVWRMSAKGERKLPSTCREPKLLDYRSVGAFGSQVKRFTDLFPAENILHISNEALAADTAGAYREVLRFLGASDDGRIEFPRLHAAGKNRSRILARLLKRPPRFVLAIAKVIKKVFGLKRLRLSSKLSAMNKSSGYVSTEANTLLDEQIRAHYAEDQKMFAQLIERTGIRSL